MDLLPWIDRVGAGVGQWVLAPNGLDVAQVCEFDSQSLLGQARSIGTDEQLDQLRDGDLEVVAGAGGKLSVVSGLAHLERAVAHGDVVARGVLFPMVDVPGLGLQSLTAKRWQRCRDVGAVVPGMVHVDGHWRWPSESVDKSVLFQFAGERSVGADLDSLRQAKAAIESGRDAQEVRRETGWFEGVDGKWRFEIDDSASYLKVAAQDWDVLYDGRQKIFGSLGDHAVRLEGLSRERMGVDSWPVGGLLHHPRLFEAYPLLARCKVTIFKSDDYGFLVRGHCRYVGSDDRPFEIELHVNEGAGGSVMGALHHEIQHAIQRLEGFAQGGSDRDFSFGGKSNQMFSPDDYRDANVVGRLMLGGLDQDQAAKRFESIMGREPSSTFKQVLAGVEPGVKGLDEISKLALQAQLAQDPKESYWRLAGEVEARNAETRWQMSPGDRLAATPSSTQDVLDHDVLISFNRVDYWPANFGRVPDEFAKNTLARGAYDPHGLSMALLEKADRSTFVHELGHHGLEMVTDIASQVGAPDDLVADVAALLSAMGAGERAQAESEVSAEQLQAMERIEVDGIARPTRNSLGQMIHPTAQGVVNFWRWFGDCDTVDEQGRPWVSFHGSALAGYTATTDIEAFDATKVGDRFFADSKGFFFTTEPVLASYYAGSDRDYKQPGSGEGVIYPVYIRARRALVIDDRFLRKQGMRPIGKDDDVVNFWDNHAGLIMDEWFKEGEHDSVVLIDGRAETGKAGKRLLVAFEPSQIKSAVGNDGSFCGDDGHLLHQRDAGPVDFATHSQAQADVDLGSQFVGQWRAMSLEQQRAVHERFARSMEAYLLGGPAAQGAEPMFAKIKDWMCGVYKDVAAFVARYGASLDDDVCDLFDRLLLGLDEDADSDAGLLMVEKVMRSQLDQSCRYSMDVNATYARMTARMYGVLAKRLGMGAQELFERYPLRVRSFVAQDDVPCVWVDGQFRPMHDSAGRLIHCTREGVVNFWKWYGAQGLVDDEGRPKVWYHGSHCAGNLDRFTPGVNHQNGDAYGIGAYFTASAGEASAYSIFGGEEGSAVYPMYARGRLIDLGGKLSEADSDVLSRFANENLPDHLKSRFEGGRVCREFECVEDARSFFDDQSKQWGAFAQGYCSTKPEAVDLGGGRFGVNYTDFNANVTLTTGLDAYRLFSDYGWESLVALGFDGVVMSREGGGQWLVMHDSDGNVKSAIGNDGGFHRFDRSLLRQSSIG